MRKQILAAVVVAFVWSFELSAQAPVNCQPAGDVQFVCGQNGPEDLVVLPGAQWVIASSFGGNGGIYLIHASDRVSTLAYPGTTPRDRFDKTVYSTCPGPPDAAAKAKFLTHGLYLLAGPNSVHRLFVVAHGSRESVEVFEVDGRAATPTLTWIGCAVAPDPVGLNSVRGLPDGGFFATNFLARGIDTAGRDKMMAGEKNGELWEWHTASGWKKVPGSEAAGANGLEISTRWQVVLRGRLGEPVVLPSDRADRRPRSETRSHSDSAWTTSGGRQMGRCSLQVRAARRPRRRRTS